MAKTPSQLKNAVPPCFRAIIDPYPKPEQYDKVWRRFDSKCIYCDKQLGRGSRDSHCDYLVPFAAGGANDIGNYVLSCQNCSNEDKEAHTWETFLKAKNSDAGVFESKKKKIEQWMQDNIGEHRVNSPELRNALMNASKRVRSEIDQAVRELKAARKGKLAEDEPEEQEDSGD